MKNHSILISILIVILCSCKGTRNNQNSTNSNEVKTNRTEVEISNKSTYVVGFDSYDWKTGKILKAKLLDNLAKHEQKTDHLITTFLADYSKVVDDLNEVLNKQSNYDTLNTLVYPRDGKVSQLALDFKRKVEDNGFNIGSSEGLIYIKMRTDFIKEGLENYLDSISGEFIKLYNVDIDTVCCDDASIVISTRALVGRVFHWGELLDKVSGLAYEKVTEKSFNQYLNLLYTGIENTPSFDRETGKYRQIQLDCMKEIISRFPESRASKEFNIFINLLNQESFERTVRINLFFADKFK